jgi:hypothetical protein
MQSSNICCCYMVTWTYLNTLKGANEFMGQQQRQWQQYKLGSGGRAMGAACGRGSWSLAS